MSAREEHMGVDDGSVAATSITAASLLTPAEVAARWQVTVGQVQRLARDGRMPCVRVGRYLRFTLAQVEAWERGGGASG